MVAIGRNYGGSKRSGVVTEIVNGRPNVVTSAGDDVLLIGAEPDTSAPSTLGCILALVREVRNDPTAYATTSWIGIPRRQVWWVSGSSLSDEHDTEAAALLAALEASP